MRRSHWFGAGLVLGAMGLGFFACESERAPGARPAEGELCLAAPPASPALDGRYDEEDKSKSLADAEICCAKTAGGKNGLEPPAAPPSAIEQARRLATSNELRTRAPALLARIDGRTEEELPLEALRISTVLMGTRARTLVDCTFQNTAGRQLEGTFHVRLPEGASPCYLGMFQGSPAVKDPLALLPPVLEDASLLLNREIALASHWSTQDGTVDWGQLRPAQVVAQERAAQVYEQVTRRRVDPALMEWAGGNTFSTRIFPITPNGRKRVFFVYDQPPVEVGGQPTVTLPIPEKLPRAFRLEVAASAKAYAKATLVAGPAETALQGEGGFFSAVVAPGETQGSFVLQGMPRSGPIRAGFGSTPGIAGTLVHARLLPRVLAGAPRPTGDAIFLLDTSLSQKTKLGASFGKVLRAVLEQDRTIERFQVIGFDVAARSLTGGWRVNTPASRESVLDAVESIWLEGATSIECALGAAENALPEGSHATLFLLSDAQVTWGLEDPRELERAHPRAFAERWVAYQVGDEAVNRPLLEKLTRRGGRIVNVLSTQDMKAAALAHAVSPERISGIHVEGAGVHDLVVAGSPETLFPGQVVEVAFRTDEEPRDATIVLETESGSQRFSIDAASERDPASARAWAEAECSSLLELRDKDADKVVVALSQRFALANRAASFLILETDAEYKAYQLGTEALDLQKVAALARAKGGRRPVGAPEIDSLDDAALAFLDRISAVALPAWPVRGRQTRHGDSSEPRPSWGDHLDPLAVYREADRRRGLGYDDEAFRVLSSVIEENPREPKALRLAAFTLMSWERYADALSLFGRVRVVRPFEPQAYLGEAFALEALGKTAEAALRYELVLAGHFDGRYEQYAKEAAKRLYGRLLGKLAGKIEPSARDRAIALGCPLAMPRYEVHLLWNLDDTDVDLHTIDSSTGEEVFYSHPQSQTGGHLLWDNTAGLGPEIYTHEKAEPAELFVHYFGTRSVAGTVPSATMIVYFRESEVICRAAVLADQKDKVVLYSTTD